MNRQFLLELLFMYFLNILVSTAVSLIIPDVYLADIITSIILAFIFALMEQWIDRIHFYKYARFWYRFFLVGIFFCLWDLLIFLIF